MPVVMWKGAEVELTDFEFAWGKKLRAQLDELPPPPEPSERRTAILRSLAMLMEFKTTVAGGRMLDPAEEAQKRAEWGEVGGEKSVDGGENTVVESEQVSLFAIPEKAQRKLREGRDNMLPGFETKPATEDARHVDPF